MMKNRNTQVALFTTSRLSPLAKPFTFNGSTFQPTSSSLFDHYPFHQLSKQREFDIVKDFSLPTFSPRITTASVAVTGMFEKGSDDVYPTGSDTTVAKDTPSKSNGTILAADESISFPSSNGKFAPLKLSTIDISSAKNSPQNQSSENIGESDSDVDSPCWKGTMTFPRSPIEISELPQIGNVEKATEKHNNLNPLAPHFFPGIRYIKDDFVSSNSCAPVVTNIVSGENMLVKTVTAEYPVELNNGIEVQQSGNTCGMGKEFNMSNDPKSKDSKAIKSVSEVFPTKGLSPISVPTPTTSSSSGVGVVTDLLKTFEGVSKSLIESPKPDVGIIVNAMHALSEVLVQTCMDGVYSYNEQGYDVIMIQQILNNLNAFSSKKCGQQISTPLNNPSCKGLELTSIETFNVLHKPYLQNDYAGENRVIKEVGQHGRSSLASSIVEDQDKDNESTQLQIIRRCLGKTVDFDQQMHPEALLFWNLWLDSEAERCYRKYKTYRYLMEAGMDVTCANVAVSPFSQRS
ncbi:uncharacterized protein LOC113853324 [Abrus precatorius]|uniref:Uncharacterized protein LOC113853324 n=1 Tax=Abrus precatorius TaxID=3816 RepID=A0A8B8K952_ABRPR|nr:uncharacterized protein LOC113853324 [Abrus precatorius]